MIFLTSNFFNLEIDMKSSLRLCPLTLLTSVALVAGTLTAAAKLAVGDPAPKLQVAKWAQGEPVTALDTNYVYIVEFWATWCGPCRESIPHLNELGKKFADRGVIVIGQDVREPNDDGVAPFVKKMGDQMTYRVALDDKSRVKEGAMAINWMKAADQNGIPTAFIVNRQGKIAWIGHPMALEESVLEQILENKFDVAAFAKRLENQQQEQEQLQALSLKFRQATQQKNWEAADAAVAEMENTVPEPLRWQFGPMRVHILLSRKDYAGAYKLVESLIAAHPDQHVLHNQLAGILATTPGTDRQGLALAKQIAERANFAAQGRNPQTLNILARIQFMTGQTNEAVGTEQKAVDVAPDEMKDYLKQILAGYQQGKLPGIKN